MEKEVLEELKEKMIKTGDGDTDGKIFAMACDIVDKMNTTTVDITDLRERVKVITIAEDLQVSLQKERTANIKLLQDIDATNTQRRLRGELGSARSGPCVEFKMKHNVVVPDPSPVWEASIADDSYWNCR